MQPSIRHRIVNLLQSGLIVLGMAAIAWISVSAVAGPAITLMAVAGVVLGLLLAPSGPRQMILSAYGARRLGRSEFPLGVRILEELARRSGLPATPALYYVPSTLPNAFAMGTPGDSVICVSDRLLRMLDRRELAGVLAHEVSHIANRDLWIMGLADVMSRAVSVISYVGQLVLLLNLPLFLVGAATVPWQLPLILIFAPSVMALLQLALSRTREYDADLGAARLTGETRGLISALAKLERRVGRFWEDIVLPGRRIPEPSLLRTHPPTGSRIARLKAVADLREDFPHAPGTAVPPVTRVTRRPRFHASGFYY